MVTLSKILDQIQSYLPGCNTRLVEKAYEKAARLHQNQVRKSGEPYFSHPLEVAYILAQMKLDLPTIAAGLLHDAVEDTQITLEEIRKEFGEEVVFIVDGVTKLKNFPGSPDKITEQAENLRKIILAMSKDLRVILVKLADRLHNMRTLDYQPEPKRLKIAKETLEIYAPIASRLGIDWIKTELEDLAFKYLYPYEYERLKVEVEKRVEAAKDYVEKVKTELEEVLEKNQIKGKVSGRVKHLYSVYKKLLKYNLTIEDLDQIYDLIGFRVIVNTVEECYKTLGIIHATWPPIQGRIKDYISLPKPNMYQSLHTTVLGPGGKKVEIQIRTEYMDKIANEGIAAHFLYKEGAFLNGAHYKHLEWLNKLIELQKELKHPREFLESLKLDLFPDEIYVFTPKGDVVVLPQGATPLDFAYAIHTEVGNRCVRAFVNEKLVPLDYKLETGDVVKIETSPYQKPSRDWLKIVKTSRARSKIKQWFKQEEREKLVNLGKEILNKELKKYGLPLNIFNKISQPNEFLSKLKVKSWDEFFYLLGSAGLSIKQILKTLSEELKEFTYQEESLELEKDRLEKLVFKPIKMETPSEVLSVDGAKDILFHLAQCCNPLPGDEVLGYITRGKGISVHRVDCPNLKDLDPERFIEVKWEKPDGRSYVAHLYIISLDRKGLLANVSSVISAAESNILKAEVRTTPDKKAYFEIYIEVTDKKHLETIISNLLKVEGILKVERRFF
ncbi:MAG: bifunctional (p)ppGpp synthetase/guanosine-3',5'-bis(diphosphate) 3'-pyrophosphohydrolase [Thermodesulfobacteriaceae bacterium]|nr:bifunctional (p)ppGpp synthetase/guanosine-3',5'-bis(diphosphate) 3'-pyrophosphohydrolase [Thermodesulfobacteriaceae bacterium]MDW8136437.1 bifunctional (p)ppGpp synthetase/guanosine-3',5'-bis(diphosphate) 3'-pyrophosphohydrolase [Thermodesulfobacterium sp.]